MAAAVRHVPAGRHRSRSVHDDSYGSYVVKKLDEAGGSAKESPAKIELDDIILAATERGLSMSDLKAMTLGQVVDYVVAYNKRQERAERESKKEEKYGKRRRATQSDINSFFG